MLIALSLPSLLYYVRALGGIEALCMVSHFGAVPPCWNTHPWWTSMDISVPYASGGKSSTNFARHHVQGGIEHDSEVAGMGAYRYALKYRWETNWQDDVGGHFHD